MLTQTERLLNYNPANTPKHYVKKVSDLLLLCFFFHESKKNTKRYRQHFTLKITFRQNPETRLSRDHAITSSSLGLGLG